MQNPSSDLIQEPTYDLVALGETMLRFTPDGFHRFEQASTMDLHVGGSESNTAVGLARLGRRVAWLSRLTDNPLGRIIERTIRSHGVDTSHVLWTDQHRVGLYFLENGPAPRGSRVIYDRANSAFSHFSQADLPSDLFRTGRSKWLLVTGISMALGEVSRQLIEHAVALARQADWKIAFDVNYRALLCTQEKAREYFDPFLRAADLVFMAHRDAIGIWKAGSSTDYESSLRGILELRQGKPTVMTLGSLGAIAGKDHFTVMQTIKPVEPIGRLGGGDAFSAGFLHSWLDTDDLSRALAWATATARLKYSISGDLPLVEIDEVRRLVASIDNDGATVLR